MSTAHFRQHFQRKLLPILRIDREFSERRRNSFLFSRPWGRWWGRIGGFFVPTCANSCSLLLTPAHKSNPTQPLETKEKSRNFNEVPGLLVEMGGIEPPSNSRPRGLLRAQSASYFSAPGIMQTCYQIGSVDEMSEPSYQHERHPVAS